MAHHRHAWATATGAVPKSMTRNAPAHKALTFPHFAWSAVGARAQQDIKRRV
jgi:hypothetical protein